MGLIYQRKRAFQPQQHVEINWSNPLAQGLLWAFNGGLSNVNTWNNLAGGGDASASTVGRSIGSGYNGRHIAVANGTGSAYTLPAESTPTSVTRAILLNTFVGGGTRTVFCGAHLDGSLELNGSNQFGIWASSSLRALSSALTAGPVLLSMSMKANNYRTYVNGLFQASLTTIAVTPAVMTSIGSGGSFGSQGFSAALLLGWQNRFFSDIEHKALAEDIWDLFLIRRRLISLPSAAVTNADIAAVDGADISLATTTVTTGAAIAGIDAGDIEALAADNWTTAQVVVSDGSDIGVIASTVTTGGAVSVIDSADIVAILASIGSTTSASLASIDGADILAASSATWMTGQIVVNDWSDVPAIGTSVTTGTAIAAIDSPDIVSVHASGVGRMVKTINGLAIA